MARENKIPKPGRPVRGSTTGVPVMALLDLLGRRWAMRVIWELREKPLRFRELRTNLNEVSPTVLNKRLKELRETAIVELVDQGYALTREGRELLDALAPLKEWALRWRDRLE